MRSACASRVTSSPSPLLVAGAAPQSAAVECTDFPAGTRVNNWSGDIQHAIGLAYSEVDPVLYTVWADHRAPLTPEVYLARSLDHGQTFAAGLEVCPTQTLRVSGNPVIAVGPGKQLTVVWAGEEVNRLDIYLVRSLDGGFTFTPPIQVNDRDLGDESLPSVRVTPAGTTFVAWIEHPIGGDPNNVRLASALPGEAFGPSVKVNGDAIASSCECCIVDVAIINEKEVYVAFMANLNYVRDLYLARSMDGGFTFADPVQLSEGHWYEPSCPTSGPRLQIGPDRDLHLVWVDAHDFATQPSVYYARTTDGVTFEDRTPLNVENDFVTGHPHFVVTEAEHGACRLGALQPRDLGVQSRLHDLDRRRRDVCAPLRGWRRIENLAVAAGTGRPSRRSSPHPRLARGARGDLRYLRRDGGGADRGGGGGRAGCYGACHAPCLAESLRPFGRARLRVRIECRIAADRNTCYLRCAGTPSARAPRRRNPHALGWPRRAWA